MTGLLEKPMLGEPQVSLRGYQREAIDAVREEFRKGVRSTLVVMATGCHHPDQGIMMFDGSTKKASDVEFGDELMGMDSTPRTVLAVHAGSDQMYRVCPVKGDPFIVSGDHIITLVQTNKKSNPRFPSQRGGNLVDVPVREWLSWSKTRKHIHKLFRVPVEFKREEMLLFDPYLAGLLLGDGTIRPGGSVGVTTADPEIVNYLSWYVGTMKPWGYKIYEQKAGGMAKTYLIVGGRVGRRGSLLIHCLRNAGIYGMTAHNKCIPHWLSTTSKDDRLQLLAGLMDSDGHCLESGGYDYISKSEKLSRGVAFVARSLGLAAYVKPCEKRCQTGNGGTYYRVGISGDADQIPCKVARKQSPPRSQIKDVLRTGFSIEPIGRGDYCGFTVDGDNRYLLDDFTVTHNCGKTHVFGGASRMTIEKGGRSLVLVHRKGLIRQVVNTLDMWGVEAGIEGNGQRARAMPFEPDAVVGMVQTMKKDNLETWDRDHFNLLVIDEAHHATAGTYERIVKHFNRARVLGVTATADRSDDVPIVGKGRVFETLAYEMTLWDGMTAPAPGPWLSRLRFVQCPVQIDLRDLSPKGEDYTDEDLAARIEPLLEVLANAIKQEAGDRQTIVFVPRVKTAEMMATALQSIGINAVSTDGEDRDREKKEEGYRRGEFQMIVNCGVYTEGTDLPETAAIALCRPTKSRCLFSQMVGRGTRLKRKHADCLVIDFDFLTAKHDLVKLTELCDSSETDTAVLEEAQELMKKDKDLDLVEAVERADKIHKERVKQSITIREREIKYRKRVYDPLDAYEALGVPYRGSKDKTADPATPGQIDALKRFKVQDAEYLSKTRASTLLDYLVSRAKQGLATVPQVHHLVANGVEPDAARAMTIGEASAYLDTIFNRRTG